MREPLLAIAGVVFLSFFVVFPASADFQTGDDAISLQWHTRAAEQGHAGAQLQLGIMYGNGYGVAANQKTSFDWYMRAASNDNAEAQWNVGIYYAQGLGVAVDVASARARSWRRSRSELVARGVQGPGVTIW